MLLYSKKDSLTIATRRSFFIILILVATSHVMGEMVTILSVDGGGIRGIIPATILAFLEDQLQELDGKDAIVVDYFVAIAGTSTGGILATMITAPNENNLPFCAARDISVSKYVLIQNFCFNYSALPPIFAPKYDGKYLHKVLQDKLGETRLHQALTNVVIPTFDIKKISQ
ncbi:hypothetical protein RDI58_019331 [Solanum bulbocastanum]|uniref:Patatin n=1 Tax=Solanum bulbocastanum TaxID=147425 RepID=A0AAN8T4G5_SOLBU